MTMSGLESASAESDVASTNSENRGDIYDRSNLEPFTRARLSGHGANEELVYMSVLGRIHDVSRSRNFSILTASQSDSSQNHPDSTSVNNSYGSLWAGRDSTYALAKSSLSPSDVDNFDFDPQNDLSYNEKRCLRKYEEYFLGKYPVVGDLAKGDSKVKVMVDRIEKYVPALSDLPYIPKIQPPLSEIQKKYFQKLTVPEVNRICHGAGFKPINTTCCIGDLSDAGLKHGRRRIEKICASVEYPTFSVAISLSDHDLSVLAMDSCLNFSGIRTQTCKIGTQVVIIPESNTDSNFIRAKIIKKSDSSPDFWQVSLLDSDTSMSKSVKHSSTAEYVADRLWLYKEEMQSH